MHILFFAYDLHGPASQDKAGADQYGEADAAGCFHARFNACDSFSLRLGDVQVQQQFFE